MTTITITIGLNSNRTLQPLSADARQAFRLAIDAILDKFGSEIFVTAARSIGTWQDLETRQWVTEDSLTWVASTAYPDAIRVDLASFCDEFEQDAIAFTTGSTELVGSGKLLTHV